MFDLSSVCQIIADGLAEIKKEEAELESAFRFISRILIGMTACIVGIAVIVSIAIVRTYLSGG